MKNHNTILVLDFGSQYTQLIARRIREYNVRSIIYPFTVSLKKIKDLNPVGIILSGGPMSVYDDNAPKIDNEIFNLNLPILGICYGMQLVAQKFDGKVEPAKNREYGKAQLEIVQKNNLFDNVKNNSTIWMSHGDYITKLPKGFNVSAKTENSPICAIENIEKKIYGLQFHPEVAHTKFGKNILSNFLFNVCKAKADWTPSNFVDEVIIDIKNKVGDSKVICALSGGVDSSVAAILLHKAIGEKLVCVHVDNGLMRKNESSQVVEMFKQKYDLNIIHIDASEEFLTKLENVSEPEKKRKIIGNTFIEIFEREADKIKDVEYLVQGTLYPDVIESASNHASAHTIKTHHNVGGLPEKMNLKLIEPFKELFKDEVREIGELLGLPYGFVHRHPFPGPGLAVRVLGKITKNKVKLLQEVDDVYISALKEYELYYKIWQAFAVLLPVQTVGVMGDQRTYEYVIALRAVTSQDGMTADWFRFEPNFLEHVSNKIIRNVVGINRVVYDISSKPPATIEWE
ncbi:MAG: glutamine-hydrolyzing GMP synthase [Ignavibacteriae bacterium]|nr:MAG: glutamine-hydrolyzing GMP synthase [Ignavibacteriota bacterium]